jgi:hypothetical protein
VWRGEVGTIDLPSNFVPGSPAVPSGGPLTNLDGLFGMSETPAVSRPIAGVPAWVPTRVGMGDQAAYWFGRPVDHDPVTAALAIEFLGGRRGLGATYSQNLTEFRQFNKAARDAAYRGDVTQAFGFMAQAIAVSDRDASIDPGGAEVAYTRELIGGSPVALASYAPDYGGARVEAARIAAKPDPRTSWTDFYGQSLAEVAEDRRRQAAAAAAAAAGAFSKYKWVGIGLLGVAGLGLVTYLVGPLVRGAAKRAAGVVEPKKNAFDALVGRW